MTGHPKPCPTCLQPVPDLRLVRNALRYLTRNGVDLVNGYVPPGVDGPVLRRFVRGLRRADRLLARTEWRHGDKDAL